MKIAYVVTASKGSKDRSYIERIEKIMKHEALSFKEIDIEGKNKVELREAFKDINVIHLEGGNTFYLLKAIRETGFDEILKEILGEGKVYIGTSAGAYVMCPTIEVSDWKSDKDRFGMTDFTALNYVPFALKVHYKDDMESLIREKITTLKYPLRILRDGQGILVENGKYTFVGDGEEVKIN